MGLKQWMQKKIEKGAIKSELDGEEVYMKKSGFLIKDWHRFYPPVNEDGSWNWINLLFGGKRNLLRLVIILLIVFMALYGIYEILQGTYALTENLCVQECIRQSTIITNTTFPSLP